MASHRIEKSTEGTEHVTVAGRSGGSVEVKMLTPPAALAAREAWAGGERWFSSMSSITSQRSAKVTGGVEQPVGVTSSGPAVVEVVGGIVMKGIEVSTVRAPPQALINTSAVTANLFLTRELSPGCDRNWSQN
jgi:hypothetical protein